MFTSGEVSTPIASVRQRVFFSAVVQAAGCQREGYALAAWQARGEPDIHPGEPVPKGYVSAWTARVNGAPMRERTREWLYARVPALREVYENVLWSVLDPQTKTETFDAALQALRVNGAPLPPWSEAALEALCGCPNWQRLGYLLIVLRSRS